MPHGLICGAAHFPRCLDGVNISYVSRFKPEFKSSALSLVKLSKIQVYERKKDFVKAVFLFLKGAFPIWIKTYKCRQTKITRGHFHVFYRPNSANADTKKSLSTSKPVKVWIFCVPLIAIEEKKRQKKRSNKKMIEDARDSRVGSEN